MAAKQMDAGSYWCSTGVARFVHYWGEQNDDQITCTAQPIDEGARSLFRAGAHRRCMR
jgi:hypothetical protein